MATIVYRSLCSMTWLFASRFVSHCWYSAETSPEIITFESKTFNNNNNDYNAKDAKSPPAHRNAAIF